MRAVGYIRVSQERSARNGFGLPAQEEDVRRHAEYKRWQLLDVYSEKGVSGYKRDRPALDRMLADAKCGKFDVVVFPSIDRVGRSVKDVIDIEMALRACGVDVIFVRECIDTSTPTGELFRNIMASISQFEGKLIRDRLSKGQQAKKAQGGYVGGQVAYGYRNGGENGELSVEPKEAAIIRRIFWLRADGMSLVGIARALTRNGVKSKKGGPWRASTVDGILRRKAFYIGSVAERGATARAHEAILEGER